MTIPTLSDLEKAHQLIKAAKAVIFDFDGVLVNTEVAIYNSWKRVYAAEGHEIPLETFNQCLGSGYTYWDPGKYLESLTGKTYDWPAINAARQAEIVRDLENEGLIPGVEDFIKKLHSAGVPMAIGSSSSHKWVDDWLKREKIMQYFNTVVCRDDCKAVKPAPDIFLKAAVNLGIAPADCVVLEDSHNGTIAAVNAGMNVISVPNRITAFADFSMATCRITAIRELL